MSDPRQGQISYAALARMADDWSARLTARAHEIAAGDRRLLIGIEFAPSADMVAAYLGALRGGHAVIVGAPGDFAPDAPLALTWRVNALISASGDNGTLIATDDTPADLHPDLCLMLSTSGSTGDPKLVRLSRTNVASNAASIAEYLGLRADDCAMTTLPLHYSYGLSVLHSHLAVGARVVLGDLSVTDPTFAAAARDVTGLALVPHQIDLMEAQGFDFTALPSLRRVTQAGGRLTPEAVRRMAARGRADGWDFIVMYGQTEAGPRMAWLPPDRADAAADTIGQAIPGGRLWIEGQDGAPLTRPGQAGALIYQGPNVMMGYAVARGDLSLPQGGDTLRTGDVAEMTSDGFFRIVGREKRFVKLFGLRLSLDQIEARLTMAGLAGHAVSVDDRLVIVARPDSPADRILDVVTTAFALPEAALRVIRTAEDPRLASGKPDLRRIAEIARAGLEQPPESTRPDRSLIAAYRSATRARRVAPEDTFLGLGGDSLAYLHVQMAIEERLGRVPEGWEDMTIGSLEHLAPVAHPRWQPIDAGTVLRVAAMACIVLFHLTFWPVSGGTFVLLILIGYSLARFQRQALADGAVLRVARSMLIPIVPIYFILIAAYDITRGHIPAEMYLLLGNLPRRLSVDLLEPLWFISLYAQIVLVVVLIGSLASIRRAIAATPFDFGLSATMIAVAVSVVFQGSVLQIPVLLGPEEGGFGPNPIRMMPVVLPLVCLGWTVFFAQTSTQVVMTLSAMALCAAILPTWTFNHIGMIVLATVLLMSRLTLRLPTPAARLLHHCAGATLFVYLAHNGVIHVVKQATSLHETAGSLMSALIVVPASFALGLTLKVVFDRIDGTLGRLSQVADTAR